MSIFPQMKDMPPEEQAKARHDLLKYCELDTLAMVKARQRNELEGEDDKVIHSLSRANQLL